MQLRSVVLASIMSMATSSCVLAQDSYVIREVFRAPFASMILMNTEGWYVQQGFDGGGGLKAILVGPKNYRRDVTEFIPQNLRFATGVSSGGDLFLAESAARGETSILRLARDENAFTKVGTLKLSSNTSVILTNSSGETLGVKVEGSRSKTKTVQVTTLSLDGKVSVKKADLRLSIPARAVSLQLFTDSDGRFTIVAQRIGAALRNSQTAVCGGESSGEDLVCRAAKKFFPRGGYILSASNGKLLVTDGSRSAVLDASSLKAEGTIDPGESGMILTSFLERDGSLGALVQDLSADTVRLTRITPSGTRLSYLCPSALGWPSGIGQPLGAMIDRDSAAFLVSGRDDSGELIQSIYELTAESSSSERSGEILGRCELEAPEGK